MTKFFIKNKHKLRIDLSIMGLILVFLLTSQIFGISWFCPFYDGLGIPCPGCGFNSAVISLLHFDFAAAFYHHPLVFVFGFYVLCYVYQRYIKEIEPKKIKFIIISFVGISLIIYCLRLGGYMPYSAQLVLNNNSLLARLLVYCN